MPPVTPSQWRTTRLADAVGPACPQAPPAAVPRDEALLLHPRARLRQLEAVLPLLVNQSEDCLYVNLYVPTGYAPEVVPQPSSQDPMMGF
ncbi:Neuroligin-2 [Eumeta japonica]|uniref:Neuroligin-2 n=1 Tax=Eumeta variegata TaxID=151549 RepID=A0A4C1TEU6_EUMVA|nr:Neuroligin-2 [Eumeta japonica]